MIASDDRMSAVSYSTWRILLSLNSVPTVISSVEPTISYSSSFSFHFSTTGYHALAPSPDTPLPVVLVYRGVHLAQVRRASTWRIWLIADLGYSRWLPYMQISIYTDCEKFWKFWPTDGHIYRWKQCFLAPQAKNLNGFCDFLKDFSQNGHIYRFWKF